MQLSLARNHIDDMKGISSAQGLRVLDLSDNNISEGKYQCCTPHNRIILIILAGYLFWCQRVPFWRVK